MPIIRHQLLILARKLISVMPSAEPWRSPSARIHPCSRDPPERGGNEHSARHQPHLSVLSLEFLPVILVLAFTSGKQFKVLDPFLPFLCRDWETEA